MNPTRLDIQGANGTATITRNGRCIEIIGRQVVSAIETEDKRICLEHESFRLLADASTGNANDRVACDLQRYLDGYQGNAKAAKAYARMIAIFED